MIKSTNKEAIVNNNNLTTTSKDDALYTPSNAHQLSVEDLAVQVVTSVETGLTSQEAAERLIKYGKNALQADPGIQFHKILFHHLFNFMSAVLLGATILSIVAKEYVDAVVIGSIIILNTVIGFFQEYRSEQTMASLRKMSQPTSRVLRDGQSHEIPSEDIVIGDVVLLREGDKVPADLRLFRVANLECDEAILTGESVPVTKHVKTLDSEKEISLGDRKNCCYMSTTITKGKGRGIVMACGVHTELGHIAANLTSSKKQTTRLQKRMDRLGLILVICAVIAIGLVLLGGYLWDTFEIYPKGLQTGISTAVAIIPEGLVPVVTLTLTLGVRKMAKNKAIIRKIGAIESLGNITNICTDKTGTLTQGKMVATHLWTAVSNAMMTISGQGLNPQGEIYDSSEQPLGLPLTGLTRWAVLIGSLCNASSISLKKNTDKDGSTVEEENGEEWVGVGSPTEVALTVLGHKTQLDKSTMENEWKFVAEFPFDSTIKCMSMVYTHQPTMEHYVFFKGAPERVLGHCSNIVTSSEEDVPGTRPMTEEDLVTIRSMNEEMAHQGLRVLSLAYRPMTSDDITRLTASTPTITREEVESDMVFVGLVGIRDPPRDAVPHSIQVCHGAGIVVHMVTGDHPATATAIARQIGILPKHLSDQEIQEQGLVTTAVEFDALTELELRSLENLPLVIARCSPASKVRMVKALHDRGKYVAMLGDGVNDSPAIKSADVGVSMGINGSDVTKEASDVVLTNDDFSTIVVAIEEGRRIFANIRKFIVHLLSGNVAESIILVIGILCFGLDPPLAPLQVLWVNMVTGTPPALALGIEPASKSIMDQRKRKVDEPLFTKDAIVDTFFYGILMGTLTLGNFAIAKFVFDFELKEAQSVSFGSLTFLLMFHAYNCRVLHRSSLREGFLKAYYLHAAVLFGIASIFLTLYIPPLEKHVFHHRHPDWKGWLIILAATVIFMALSEIWKGVKNVYRKKPFFRKKKSATTTEMVDVI